MNRPGSSRGLRQTDEDAIYFTSPYNRRSAVVASDIAFIPASPLRFVTASSATSRAGAIKATEKFIPLLPVCALPHPDDRRRDRTIAANECRAECRHVALLPDGIEDLRHRTVTRLRVDGTGHDAHDDQGGADADSLYCHRLTMRMGRVRKLWEIVR